MRVNFYPDSDNKDFLKAAEEYKKIWSSDGEKIVRTIERISGLKFKEKLLNVIVYHKRSWALPMCLYDSMSTDQRKRALIHELCHRILIGNGIEKVTKDLTSFVEIQGGRLNSHVLIDLIFFDILEELYGYDFAMDCVKYEIYAWGSETDNIYKDAWDWALKLTKEERQNEFKNYFQILDLSPQLRNGNSKLIRLKQ